MAAGSFAPGASSGENDALLGIPLDRRLARGIRTRTIIADAVIDLIDSGNQYPSTRLVAARAGVSLRTVFNHFGDVEILFRSAAGLHLARHRSLVADLPPRGPAEARIRATCHQRRELFEAIGPVLRVAHARAQGSPSLNEVLVQHRARLRRQLEVTLAPEIRARGQQAKAVLDAVELATGWQSWSALRFEAGRSASLAEQFMVFAVIRMLC
jgi:TetR/AcrR family transcriptional regulator, regulator of autoinduction and epiphytic fitness